MKWNKLVLQWTAYLFVAALFWVLPVQPAEAAAKYRIRLGFQTPESYPWTDGMKRFKELAEQRLPGEIEIKIFAGGVLGSDNEMIEAIRAGNLEMAILFPGALGTLVPEAEIVGLPYLFRDEEHYDRFVESDVARDLWNIMEKKGQLTNLGVVGKSKRHIITRKKPIFNVEDIKGLKMRMYPSVMLEEMWKALGAIPTLVAYAEVYTALQTGVVDGAENEPATFFTYKWAEPAEYVCLTAHDITIRNLVIGTEYYKKLPKQVQDALAQAAKEACAYERDIESKFDQEALQKCQSKYGVKVTMPNTEEFFKATGPVRQKMVKKWGMEDMLKRILGL
jgi:tripartite ATP-independent transporter DctP family solute receptor